MKDELVIYDLFGCQRCGEDHHNLRLKKFTNPVELFTGCVTYTHWAMCPKLDEPIIVDVVAMEEVKE